MDENTPMPYELWLQAGGGSANYDEKKYIDLLREHGHLVAKDNTEKKGCTYED